MSPFSISDAPKLVEKPRKTWIKDNMRRLSSDTGWMNLGAKFSRGLFGKFKQGRYGQSS